jgi:hypothetical protein
MIRGRCDIRTGFAVVRLVSVSVLVSAWLVSIGAGVARAETSADLYKKGLEQRRAGRDIEAVATFKQIYANDPNPTSAAQLGLAEQAAGLWVDAEKHVDEALHADHHPWIKKNRAALKGALETIQGRLGRLEIVGEPAGAEVLIDGNSVGILPLPGPVRVVVGNLPVSVRAPGYLERSTTVTVGPRQFARERFALKKKATSAPDSIAAPAGDPAARRLTKLEPAPSPERIPTTPASVEPDDGTAAGAGPGRRATKWVAWGLGVAAAGVGGYGLWSSQQAGNTIHGPHGCGIDPATMQVVPADGTRTAGDCRALNDRIDSMFRLEVIGFAMAGALATTGLILWLTEPAGGRTTEDREHAAALACVPGLGAGGALSASCALRF